MKSRRQVGSYQLLSQYLWLLLCIGVGCHGSPPPPIKLQAAPASASTPAAALVSEAKPPPPTRPTFNPKKQLLYDAKEPRHLPGPPEEEEQALLTKLFPRRLKDMAGCREVASREEALAEGLFYAEIPSSVEGFFTRNDLPQRAYLVEVHLCDVGTSAASEEGPPVGYALVVTGQEPFVPEFTTGRMRVLAVADVDQDGLHEVLLATSSGGYGDPMVHHAALYRYEGGRFVYKNGSWEVSNGEREISLYFQPTAPGEMPKIIEKRVR